jgi:hypothetical protein
MCRERETLSGRMPERQLNREDERERADLRGYMPYRERFGYVPTTERRLCEGCVPRKRLNIAERLRVEDEGYVCLLRGYVPRERRHLAERLRAVDLRVVEYTQKQKQTANRRGRRPEREATAARRRHESTKAR